MTTFASSRALGDTTRLTYDDLNFMAANSKDFDSVFDKHRGRIWLLGNILDASGSKLVDWRQGGNVILTPTISAVFWRTMKAMPEEKEELPSPTLYKSVSMSRGLLYYVITNDLWMASTAPLAYGEDYCFPGLPELGSAIYPNCCYGISAYSQNKELCWQFLRQFLTREYGSRFYLSPRKDALAQLVEDTWTGFADIQQYHPHGLEAMEQLMDIGRELQHRYAPRPGDMADSLFTVPGLLAGTKVWRRRQSRYSPGSVCTWPSRAEMILRQQARKPGRRLLRVGAPVYIIR